MRTRGAAAAAGLLLLIPLAALPLAAAEGVPAATLTASSVRLDRGTLAGDLAGAKWIVAPPDDEVPRVAVGPPAAIDVPWFQLQAASAVLTTYATERTGPSNGETRSVAVERTGLRIEGPAVGDEDSARILVLPFGQAPARVQLGGPALAVPVDTGFDTRPRVTGPDYHLDPVGNVLVQALLGQQVALTGSFRLVLDAIDVPYRSDQGDARIETRRVVEDGYPTAYYGTTTVSSRNTIREAVLDVTDGTLLLTGADLYLPVAEATTSAIDLAGSTGSLAGQDADDMDVHAEGQIAATLTAQDGGEEVQVSLRGRLDRLAIGGQPVPVPPAEPAATTARQVFQDRLLVGLLLLAMPLLPAAQYAAGRRRFTRMDRALDRGDFQAALRLAGRFTPWPGQRQDSVLAAAICLLGLGRPREACERLSGPRWSAHRRPMRDFLRARGHAALGQVAEAQEALAASLLAEPSLAAQARTDPVLAALADALRDPKATQEAYA